MQICTPFDINCPHRLLLDQISDKWSVMVLTVLDDEPARFNAVRRRLAGITQKSLTQSLRRLERNGLVGRRVVSAPLAVEYRITPLGRTVLVPILALYAWTVARLAEVEQARREFDRRADGAGDAGPDRGARAGASAG